MSSDVESYKINLLVLFSKVPREINGSLSICRYASGVVVLCRLGFVRAPLLRLVVKACC